MVNFLRALHPSSANNSACVPGVSLESASSIARRKASAFSWFMRPSGSAMVSYRRSRAKVSYLCRVVMIGMSLRSSSRSIVPSSSMFMSGNSCRRPSFLGTPACFCSMTGRLSQGLFVRALYTSCRLWRLFPSNSAVTCGVPMSLRLVMLGPIPFLRPVTSFFSSSVTWGCCASRSSCDDMNISSVSWGSASSALQCSGVQLLPMATVL